MKKENNSDLQSNHYSTKINIGLKVDVNQQIKINQAYVSAPLIVSISKDTSSVFDDNGVRFVYGYEFTDKATEEQKRMAINYIKGLSNPPALYSEEVEDFVDLGVAFFDDRYSFRNFKTVVYRETSELAFTMSLYIKEEFREGNKIKPFVSFEDMKEAYDHVEFDSEKVAQALRKAGVTGSKVEREVQQILGKFDELKRSWELSQLKEFVPKEIREELLNYLKFQTNEERKDYEALQGVNVLTYDDLMSEEETVNEMIRYLRAIHEKNTLTVFVLMKG